MGFKCGIVGLPNVGKSTLFNALTSAGIAAENYPFCTIDPNIGVVPVPDARLEALAAIVHPRQILPTVVEFVDIAGLVAGASQGEGLGNKFLAHIRETEAIAQVVRCFPDPNVVHIAGAVNPRSDIETISTELALADLESAERARARASKSRSESLPVLERVVAALSSGETVRSLGLSPEEQLPIRDLQLLTAKPMLYIANIGENPEEAEPYLAQIREAASGAEVITICATLESEIAALPPESRAEFLADLGLEEPGLARIIRAGHKLLGLQSFFTAGPKEVRAWTVKNGATAPAAAGAIHTDFAKGFIRAEVISYADYIACGGEQRAKEAGKWRLEGKDYIVQDGDVMHFRFKV